MPFGQIQPACIENDVLSGRQPRLHLRVTYCCLRCNQRGPQLLETTWPLKPQSFTICIFTEMFALSLKKMENTKKMSFISITRMYTFFLVYPKITILAHTGNRWVLGMLNIYKYDLHHHFHEFFEKSRLPKQLHGAREGVRQQSTALHLSQHPPWTKARSMADTPHFSL